ncbi:mannitol dehydrogenase family protein [Acidisoma cellulosilytica]|uniref:Mannitol dehydrogenase family protein n=1 Tax=Acidisoma cellulosilyticum TaxID=2802395 RepID=A0A964E4B6_9PROT|nr:mannitol dehydrogenase family protein [Acidisoma cellulosilyticum]MCB8881309.1 mannitol dehydrogenase family protein [Acidisoma cellulosilyticum]
MSIPRLSESVLPRLPPGIAVPAYDRAQVAPGIVHLGVGAFHRAHQALFIDDVLGRGETDWGIIAASLRSADTRDAIGPQDNLYTYCERNGESESLRIVGSILETLVAPEDPERLIRWLSDPRIRIVTLTVTEKGYLANLAERRLLHDHPDIRWDLAQPEAPRTIYGFLLAAIRRRRADGAMPLTLLSCDNLPANGRVLRALLLEFAERADPSLVAHIAQDIACPCAMVDRIVPATSDADRATVAARLGATDAWPVVAEPYFRWVIEDRFPHGRPKLEFSGVEFVANVEPYEHMKLRMLNGAHTAIAAIGQIAGLETVADVYGDPRARRFIDRYWREVAPTLSPETDGPGYTRGLQDRFANPALRHRTVQIASDASQKVPQRLLAPLAERMRDGQAHGAVLMALALWIRSCAARSEGGLPTVIHDPAFNAWHSPDQATLSPEAIIDAFLGFDLVFGPEWRAKPGFAAALTEAYRRISTAGALAALDQFD